MTIRLAHAPDLAAIRRIAAAAYSKYIPRIGKPPGPMLADYAALISDQVLWLAELDGSVAGLLVLLPAGGHLLLDNIAVDPALQGRGVGRALLQFADQEAARRGFCELRLYTHETMTENLTLYPALGWEETGRGEQDGYNRVFFRKAL